MDEEAEQGVSGEKDAGFFAYLYNERQRDLGDAAYQYS